LGGILVYTSQVLTSKEIKIHYCTVNSNKTL
jgi:hypothetical protein